MKQHYLFFFFRLLLLMVIATPLAYSQTTVSLDATKDNSIYSENNNSNGSGANLFAGRTNEGNLRRLLVQFDLDGIPSGATVTDVSLRLVGNRQSTDAVTAHRLNADWGESTSDAAGQEGRGAAAGPNDATWNFNFFNSESWSTAGGDFVSAASATDGVSSGAESIWEGSGMVADVQAWLDGTAENFGWILIGDENQNSSAVRLASKENSSVANHPTLEITYEVDCAADGGTIAIADGGGDVIDICVGDGESDAFSADLSDAVGSNSTWVITDADANILMLSNSNTFDLEGAGEGVCLIWHLSFEDDLTGAEIGNNASQLGGCFDLSNPITVNRTGVDGGVIALEDGSTELTICAGDGVADPFTVNLDSASGTNSIWVITDAQVNILALADTNVFDLDGAGGGVCLVWHLSFEDGLDGAEVGANAADLDGCYDLSNPITVNRNGVDGGVISIAGSGEESIDICAGDGMSDAFTVELTGNEGSNSTWVITDADANILAIADTNVFDLEGAGPGVCLVWHLSYEDDLMGAAVGNNAADLTGCFDLSNPITVNRTGVNGGEIALEDGGTEFTICAGDGTADPFTVNLTGAEGANSAWVITDADANILGVADTNVFDFDGAGPGLCLVWHLSFADGLTGAEVGNNAADLMGCFDLSNPISVTRNQPDGGVITIANGGGDVIDICVGDGTSDAFTVDLDSAMGTNSIWVITDADANILALADTNVFDLEGAGPGVCLVWHLSFEDGLMGAAVGNNAADLTGCFDLSNPITVNRTGVNGGEIALEDGGTELTICAGDGTADPFTVNLTGAEGANSAWVITDADANILGVADTNVFDFDGAGPGLCLVWHLSFADGLTGAEVGNNAADLMGCFDLSNPVSVTRNQPDGGIITIANGGGDVIDICAGDGTSDAFTVDLDSAMGTNSIWVITDADANILALADTNVFDLEGAGPGVCLVWHLSYEDGLMGAAIGNNAADLTGCFDLSNPITVNRTGVNGGEIALEDGGTELTICAGDGTADPFTVNLTGAEGANSAWVITDADANILAIADTNVFDLDGAGPGICLVWHLSFADGLTGAEVGNNASDLMGCFDLSNPISINRIEVDSTLDGGMISLEDGSTETTICAGDGTSDALTVSLTGASGMNSAWVITDADANILAIADTNVIDLEGAGPGVCLIWHLSFSDGLMGAAVGNNAADLQGCFSLSNPITVNRDGVDGGTIALEDGSTEITICAGDDSSDAFSANLDGATGSNSAWVITDADANILAIADTNVFDLDGAGPGVCLVWHLSFEEGLMGAAVGNNAADLMGCFDLSNPITVNRTGVDGGMIELTDGGGTELTICAGDGTSDEFAVTLSDAAGANSAWVITDANANILALADTNVFDLEGAGAGVCLIWHLSFEDGLTGVEVGNNAADLMGCFDLSNPITVTRDTTGEICVTSTSVLQAAEVDFTLWPNPANDELSIEARLPEQPKQLILEVRSTVGQIVIRKTLDQRTAVNERLNISVLPEGLYFLTLRTEKAIVTDRFFKQ